MIRKRIKIERLKTLYCFLSLLIIASIASAQKTTISGKILDLQTREPIAGVGVYLLGTSIGVVSGLNGNYSISYDEAINTPLIFAYLGYEKIQIVNPITTDLSTVVMKQQENELDAVVINPDPWDRATKEKLFLDHFLGVKSLEDCEIVNLKDVRLRFNTTSKQMIAYSKSPIIIYNRRLGYQINYDLVEFEINFNYWRAKDAPEQLFEMEHARSNYSMTTSFTAGFSFYKELEDSRLSERKKDRRREKAYKLSQLKLYRSIMLETMKEDKFQLFYRGFRVSPEDHIRVRKEQETFKVTFRNLKYTILDRADHQTDIYLADNVIYFDGFDNLIDARKLMLSGYLPQLGVGGMMPLDYDLPAAQKL